MNRRTFIKATGITLISAQALASIEKEPKWSEPCTPDFFKCLLEPQWIRLKDTLPKKGQRIIVVMRPFSNKVNDFKQDWIGVGTVRRVDCKRWAEYELGLLMDMEIWYKKIDDKLNIYERTYKNTMTRNKLMEYQRKITPILRQTIVTGKQGSDFSFTFNSLHLCKYRNNSPDCWCPIDEVPNKLPHKNI